MSRMIITIGICIATLLILRGAAAQEPVFPQPGPEHAKLKMAEGTWDTVTNMMGQESKGVMTYKMDLGGLWLVGDFVASDPSGMVFKGKSLDSYDAIKKKYVNIWIDSMSTSPMISEGTYDEAGKVVSMTGTGPGMDGKPAKYRTTVNHESQDKMVMTMHLIPADGQEQPLLTVTYTRRK